MSLNNYPYFIYGLYKKIIKEKDSNTKFFLTVDLFYSILRLIYFIINQKYIKENKNLYKQFKKSIYSLNKDNLFIKDIITLFKENIFLLDKIDGEIKNVINNKDINFSIQTNKQIYIDIKKLIYELNKGLNLEILVPNKILNNKIQLILINGEEISSKTIDNNIKINQKDYKNTLILLYKNEVYKYKTDHKNEFYTSSSLVDAEITINNFAFNITKNNDFRIKIIDKVENTDTIEKNEDIHIKRDHVIEKINNFIKSRSGYLFLVGAYGTGKTTLLNDFEKESNYNVYKTTINKANYKKNINEILDKLSISKEVESSQDFLNILHTVKNKEKQIIIFEDIHLIDKIDDFLKLFPQKLPENIYIFFSMAARENIVLPMLENRELYYIPSFSYNETKMMVNKISNYQNLLYNESIDEVIKKTYGFPLFIKIHLYKNDYFLNKRFDVEKKFLNLVEKLEEFTIRYDSKLKRYAKYFFTLLSISKEGFTRSEITSILPAISNILIENYIDHCSDYLVKVNSRYRLSSYIFEEVCVNYLCDSDDLNFLHNKIIEFYEPWDKKVNSLALKYLPYHYIEVGKLDKAKKLMMSSFTKSKFKLYGKETLDDLYTLIKQIIKENGNLYEIFNFAFIYQRLKDTQKREFIYILDMVEEGNFSEIISKSLNINKSFERFLQLLLIAYLAIDNNKYSEARFAIKKMMSIPNNPININNSEMVFKIGAEILSKGIFDIINLPRNREDGVNIIKNLKESDFSYKVIEVILRLLETIFNEIDKSVMLEALMNKIIDFENISTIEKFYKNILVIINKIDNENIRDRLYHVYILCILKKPDLYDIFLDNLIELKLKVSTSLFKYLFYSSLSVLFIKLNQEKISYDYINKSISFIEDLDNLSHIPFMISNIIFTLKNFENTYFYDEIVHKIFYLIQNISFTYEGIHSQLNLINSIKYPEKYKKEIKTIIEQILKIGIDNRNDTNNIIFTKSYIDALFKINDKRTFNALYNKIIKNIKNKSEINQISIYLSILENNSDQNIFRNLIEVLNNKSTEVIDINSNSNILAWPQTEFGNSKPQTQNFINTNAEQTKNKVIQIIENITNKNPYATEIIDNVMYLIPELNESDLSLALKTIIDNMDRKNISPADKFSEHIYNICNGIDSVAQRLKVLVHLALYLVNVNQKDSGLQLMRRIFSVILSENEQVMLEVILEILENSNNIKDNFRKYYLYSDILVNIYNISHYIKNDDIQIQIIDNVFKVSVKMNFTDLKNIFYRTLEIANKTVNAKSKMQIINMVRKYINNIKDKNFVVDIIQKSILISEENFSENDLKLMSLSSLAYVNRTHADSNRGKQLFKRLLAEMKFSSYQEYLSEVIIHMSKFIYKINPKDEAISIYKQIIENDYYITSDYYLFNTYSALITNINKISDLTSLYDIYILLIKISIKIENPYYKSEYLSRLMSGITNFKFSEKSLDLIDKIFNLSYLIKDEKELSIFYKSFIISINKSLSIYPLVEIENFNDKIVFYLNSMEKSVDLIKSDVIKAELYSLLGLAYYKFDKEKDKKNNYFKKSVNLIKDIGNSENKTGIETLTALRIIASKDSKYGNKILSEIAENIIKQNDDKEKLKLFEIFASYKNHISKSEIYKEYIESMISGLLSFKSDIFKNKMYVFAFNYYYKNKDIENTYLYIDKAEKSINSDDSYDSTEQKISLAMNLINLNQFNKGSNLLLTLIKNIKSKPKRIMYELYIKIFSEISMISASKYSRDVYENILTEISLLNLKEVSEQDLYILANSYINIKDVDKFNNILNYIDNYNQKEYFLNTFIDKLNDYKDITILMKLLPLTLSYLKLIDKIIASIILLTVNKDEIEDLNNNLSI